MKRTGLALAALGLLVSAAIHPGPALANGEDDAEQPAGSSAPAAAADDTEDDDALKVLEGDFSIPAADGESAKPDEKSK